MKLSIILSSLLFAASISAAPRAEGGLGRRVEQRATRTRGTRPAEILEEEVHVEGDNVTNVQYSSNWAGAVLTAPPAGSTFTSVSAQFVVPQPSAPGTGTYSASIWVGIDGDTYQNSILQAGVDVTVTKRGSTSTYSYDSWYEWYPAYAVDFSTSAFSFTAGDTISVSVTSSSSTKGTVVLTNERTGESVTQTVSASSSTYVLGGQNAEWIVEDYEENGSLVPFADFGTVDFTNAVAKTSSGVSEGPAGATIIEIKSSSGTVLTDVSVGSSSVEVVYV